jgi:hypothetical protein
MAVDMKNTLTQEEAVKLALEIERVEAALKLMKNRLKEFVDANGPLQAGDKTWDYYPSVTCEFEPEKKKELAVAIAAEGKNPWEYLTFPASAIKSLGWSEESLLAYGDPKINRRFDSRKV